MATQPGDIIEAAARAEINGSDDIVNSYQFRFEEETELSDGNTVNDIIKVLELIYVIVEALQSTFVLYKDIRITNKTQQQLLGTVAWDTVSQGTAVGDAIPPGVAALINFSTTISRVMPRKYFGGFTVANLDQDGTWDTALVAEMVDIGDILLAPITVQNRVWQYGYLSPKTLAFEIPVSAVTNDVGAYQRRRKPGRGS